MREANTQTIRFFDVDRHGHGELRLEDGQATVDVISPEVIVTSDAPIETLASFRLDAEGGPMEIAQGAQW